jgi:uncharacterized membrane protein YfcA
MTIITALFIALGLFALYYFVVLAQGIKVARAAGEPITPTPIGMGIGFVTNFFDTLGIGSFATTTAFFRWFKQVRDEQIPGTLNVGHTPPTLVEAITLIALFRTAIDPITLVELIVAAVAGAWFGANLFSGWSRRKIQVGMGVALLGFVVLMFYRTVYGDPTGGAILKLTGPLLIAGVIGNFLLGVLMTLGIGLYAPCMILVSLLGMSPISAFPVMMGSCAFLMPVATRNFVKSRAFNLKACMGLMIGGVPGVLLAAYVVKSIPLYYLKWLVMAVVVYTAISLLLTARRERGTPAELAPAATT